MALQEKCDSITLIIFIINSDDDDDDKKPIAGWGADFRDREGAQKEGEEGMTKGKWRQDAIPALLFPPLPALDLSPSHTCKDCRGIRLRLPRCLCVTTGATGLVGDTGPPGLQGATGQLYIGVYIKTFII